MNDPRDVPRTHASSERWQIELDAQIQDAQEREALRAVISLLRRLPDPEPPDDLIPRVLAHVAARDARPVLVRGAFRVARGLVDARGALMLAAGFACLLAVASFEGVSVRGPVATSSRAPTSDDRSRAVVGRALPRARRSTPVGWPPSAVAHPQVVSLMNSYPQGPTPRIRLGLPRIEDVDLDRRLDRQLNRLLLDPTVFCERLERVAQRDALIARLADRAARRGDATQVALRVRQADHPLGPQLVDRFLRASLARYGSRH